MQWTTTQHSQGNKSSETTVIQAKVKTVVGRGCSMGGREASVPWAYSEFQFQQDAKSSGGGQYQWLQTLW